MKGWANQAISPASARHPNRRSEVIPKDTPLADGSVGQRAV
ncbi:MAG: hypothetical protein K0S79_2948, partial [Nitrospira sp.]|nr:hypothetical protein [Nitrospira sp.]